MITFLTVVHIATVVLLVITVLLQSGKGAEISASFGGSSQTVFGSSGGVNFFQKLTYGLAAVFMVTSLTLTILPSKVKKSVFEGYTPPPATTLPIGTPAMPLSPEGAAAKNSGQTTGAPAKETGQPVSGAQAVKMGDAAKTTKPANEPAATPAKK